MPETVTSPHFDQLKSKLRELFELDKADLDFGIYRILRQRHNEISEFLDNHLARTVQDALASHAVLSQAQVLDDLKKAEAAAQAAGFDPEQSPKVKELREKIKSATDTDALADEVYSHLYTFFSRYYQGGDFLGLQRSTVKGRERYMIPYNGEEVKLVWANMDQYYIKSSELLRDYIFHLSTGDFAAGQLPLGLQPENVTIQFKLVQGDTEKDNVKPDGKTTRAFALDDEKPFEELNATTLVIRFHYSEMATERNLQEKLNADAVKKLAEVLPAKWRAILFANDPTYQPKDKKDTRTLLEKHLRAYTAKFQFDYFIHKDLGGFLKRELDFYCKNEVMFLDDIDETTAPKAEEYLSKLRAIRRCALPIIRMLAQLEDFQKKLWLKKKFVVETRYCLTLDRVPETLYAEICDNDAQWDEWEKLYTLSEIPKDMFTAKPRTPEFLKQQPYLMLDTRHFAREFTLKLLASLDNLDESLDGVCFHSENFQALQLMQERYREQVKCVYIDPPYNTGNDGFTYKDRYQHSSWLTMLAERLRAQSLLFDVSGVFFASIDDNEASRLRICLDSCFSKDAFEAQIVVQSNKRGQTYKSISKTHEYLFVYSAGEQVQLNEFVKSENTSSGKDELGSYELWELRNRNPKFGRFNRPNLFYPLYVSTNSVDENGFAKIFIQRQDPNDVEVFPRNSEGDDSCWRWGKDKVEKTLLSLGQKGLVAKQKRDGAWGIYEKSRKDTTKPKSIWTDTEFISEQGTIQVGSLGLTEFGFPKPVGLIEQCLIIGSDEQGLVLDYFGGSGTTGHAVINLNRDGKEEKRKYVLVEMGDYFETVLVPRLKKVVYATNWKDGKPQTRNTGISHAFKIVRLESYEDTLNNLRLTQTPAQQAALAHADAQQHAEYMLGYFLDVESAGSASLLDVQQFRDPFHYQLQIAASSAGETQPTTIDLVETFNWLIGLKVKHIDSQKGFVTVTGEKRAGGRTLIVWRTLSDDALADNLALEQFLAKLEINPADTEYEFIYVNGSHTLNDPHNKIHLIEEEFARRMFDVPDLTGF